MTPLFTSSQVAWRYSARLPAESLSKDCGEDQAKICGMLAPGLKKLLNVAGSMIFLTAPKGHTAMQDDAVLPRCSDKSSYWSGCSALLSSHQLGSIALDTDAAEVSLISCSQVVAWQKYLHGAESFVRPFSILSSQSWTGCSAL